MFQSTKIDWTMENHSKFSGKVTNVKKNNRGEMRKQIVCLSRSTKINRTLEVLTRRLKKKERKSIQHWKSSHEDKENRKKEKRIDEVVAPCLYRSTLHIWWRDHIWCWGVGVKSSAGSHSWSLCWLKTKTVLRERKTKIYQREKNEVRWVNPHSKLRPWEYEWSSFVRLCVFVSRNWKTTF